MVQIAVARKQPVTLFIWMRAAETMRGVATAAAPPKMRASFKPLSSAFMYLQRTLVSSLL